MNCVLCVNSCRDVSMSPSIQVTMRTKTWISRRCPKGYVHRCVCKLGLQERINIHSINTNVYYQYIDKSSDQAHLGQQRVRHHHEADSDGRNESKRTGLNKLPR